MKIPKNKMPQDVGAGLVSARPTKISQNRLKHVGAGPVSAQPTKKSQKLRREF